MSTPPNYIDALAADIGRVVPDCPPELLRLYALLALTAGERVTLENVHDAWAAWRAATRPDHPSLVPFGELSPEVQALDEPYRDAIRQVAGSREGRRSRTRTARRRIRPRGDHGPRPPHRVGHRRPAGRCARAGHQGLGRAHDRRGARVVAVPVRAAADPAETAGPAGAGSAHERRPGWRSVEPRPGRRGRPVLMNHDDFIAGVDRILAPKDFPESRDQDEDLAAQEQVLAAIAGWARRASANTDVAGAPQRLPSSGQCHPARASHDAPKVASPRRTNRPDPARNETSR